MGSVPFQLAAQWPTKYSVVSALANVSIHNDLNLNFRSGRQGLVCALRHYMLRSDVTIFGLSVYGLATSRW